MVIGVLQVELRIHDSDSLKDKRRVVRSVKDRLHREHQVSVAEVGALDSCVTAILGISVVGSDGKRVAQTLDRICDKLLALHDAEVVSTRRNLIHGQPHTSVSPDEPAPGLAEEMLARAARLGLEDAT